MPACIGVTVLVVVFLEAADDFDACSFREEFLAFMGILPDMYRAALPAPGLMGGSRRAMTDVARGMRAVSSSYSSTQLISCCLTRCFYTVLMLTFFPIFGVDCEVEICSVT
jgi:hypothetical protein